MIDDNFQPITAVHMSAGFLAPADSAKPRRYPPLSVPVFGITPGYAPFDPEKVYSWKNYNEVAGIAQTSPEEEVTDITRVAEVQWRGPTNFLEWYYAQRPHIDVLASGMLQSLRGPTGKLKNSV